MGEEVGGDTDSFTQEWEAAWAVISMKCFGEGSSISLALSYKTQKPRIIQF